MFAWRPFTFLFFFSIITVKTHASEKSCEAFFEEPLIQQKNFVGPPKQNEFESNIAQDKEKIGTRIQNAMISRTTKYGSLISEDKPNQYAQLILEEYLFNFVKEEENQIRSTSGFNEKTEANIQNNSASNGIARVTSYFRYYEKSDKKTYETVEAFWNRKRSSPLSDNWIEAVDKTKAYLNNYKKIKHDLMSLVAQGYEALALSRVTGKMLSEYSASDFATLDAKLHGIKFKKPLYRYYKMTGKIKKVTTESVFYRYDTLVHDHKSALILYEKIFGITPSPYQHFKNERKIKKPYDWSQLKSPGYIILSPLYLIGGGYQLGKSTVVYLKKTGEWAFSFIKQKDGAFHKRMVSQVLEGRRLETVREALLSRSKNKGVPLNAEEAQLVQEIDRTLRDFNLLPNSKAFHDAQKQEFEAEKTMVFGRDEDLESQKNLKSLTLYEERGQDPGVVTVQSYYMDKAKRKIKQWAPTFIVGVVILGTVTTQYNKIKERVLDYPPIAYHLTEFGNIFYDLEKKYFGLDSLVRSDVIGSDRTFNLEVTGMPNVAKDGTQIFQDQYRIDQKNFLSDPEYQKQIREIIETTLQEREKRGGAIAYQYSVEQTKTWGYPTRTVKILFEDIYNSKSELAEQLKQLEEQLLNMINNGVNIKELTESQIEELIQSFENLSIKDHFMLNQFLSVKLPEAIDYYAINGDLLNPTGSVYERFVKLDKEVYRVLSGWIVRSAPRKEAETYLFENFDPRFITIIEEVPNTDYVMVNFLDKPSLDVNLEGVNYYLHRDAIVKKLMYSPDEYPDI